MLNVCSGEYTQLVMLVVVVEVVMVCVARKCKGVTGNEERKCDGYLLFEAKAGNGSNSLMESRESSVGYYKIQADIDWNGALSFEARFVIFVRLM